MLYGTEQQTTDRGFRIKTVRFPENLHNSITRIADASGETFSAAVRALLRAAVEQRGTHELHSRG